MNSNNNINSMSSRNVSPRIRNNAFLSTDVQERPHKKTRRTSKNIVLVATDQGIANFYLKRLDTAERCFSEALFMFNSGFSNDPCKLYTNFTTNGTIFLGSPTTKAEATKCINQQQSTLSKERSYDEGLSICTDVLHIKDLTQKELVASALLYNMGQIYVSRCDYQAAAALFERSNQQLRQPSPFDLGQISMKIKILTNLGYCNYQRGANNEAIQYYEQALAHIKDPTREKDSLAGCLNSIGILQFHTGNQECTKDTLAMLQTSLSLYQSVFRGESTSTEATVLNNIGRVHYLLNEYNEAIIAYQRALEIRRQVLGDYSIDTSATIFNLAQCCRVSEPRMLDDSVQYYKEYVKIMNSLFGKKVHPDLAHGLRGIAEINFERSKFKLAFRFYKATLQVQRATLDRLSPEIAATLNKLGNVAFELREYHIALKYYQEGLEIEQQVLDPDHPHITISHLNTAHVCKTLGLHDEALAAFRKAHSLKVAKFGAASIEAVDVLSSMGLCQYQIGCYEDAFESFQEALRIRRDYHGADDHPDVASTLNSIGLVLYKQGRHSLSLSCFNESLRIRKAVLGSTHRDVAILHYNMGTVHFEMGNGDSAIGFYKEGLRVERDSLGQKHPDTVLTLQHLGRVCQQLGHLDDALTYYREALEIEQTKSNMKGHPAGGTLLAANLLNQIGNICLQQGNVDDMMSSFTETSRIYQELQHPLSSMVIGGYTFYGLSKTHPPCAEAA